MTLKIQYKPIADLIPYARNSRTHDEAQVAQIAASIREFGWTNPVLLDGNNGIIAGHGRVLAAQKLGEIEVPTIELGHMSESQKRAYIIADNKLALNAGWDNEMLLTEFTDLKAVGYDMELTGFSLDEIATLNPEIIEGLTDEDAVPDVPDEPTTKLGDVWLLGNHRLMCGDSCSLEAVEKLTNGGGLICCSQTRLTTLPMKVAQKKNSQFKTIQWAMTNFVSFCVMPLSQQIQ